MIVKKNYKLEYLDISTDDDGNVYVRDIYILSEESIIKKLIEGLIIHFSNEGKKQIVIFLRDLLREIERDEKK